MNRIFSFSICAAIGLLLSGCYKVEETVANIYVVREEAGVEVPVSDATVRLFALGSLDTDNPGTPRFDTTQVTNAAGSVSFNFSEYYKQGQAGFAVLDIEATKGSLNGIGIIKIEEEMTNEQTVIME